LIPDLEERLGDSDPARAASVEWRRGSGDAGFVGGFEGLLFGLLLFAVGTLLIGYAWAVIDTKSATQDAARQAARTYVEGASAGQAASSAEEAVDASLAGYGRNPARAAVTVVAGSFGRCQRITIAVSYPAPLMILPFVGRVGSGSVVRAEHSELIDPYRSGLPGTATCP
jgi:hypothetical protein